MSNFYTVNRTCRSVVCHIITKCSWLVIGIFLCRLADNRLTYGNQLCSFFCRQKYDINFTYLNISFLCSNISATPYKYPWIPSICITPRLAFELMISWKQSCCVLGIYWSKGFKSQRRVIQLNILRTVSWFSWLFRNTRVVIKTS